MSGVRITNCATGADRLWPFASSNATMRQLESAFRASLHIEPPSVDNARTIER
jgi:hypothetical protein